MLKVAFLPTNFGDSAKILTLPHPRNKKPNDFVISDGKLYEIQLFDRPHSSFFVNNSVISDGSALFAHQIHPLFMALPEMFENQKEFQMKKDFFYNSKLKPIEDMIFPYFDLVCSTIPYDDQELCYALDTNKMLDWLIGRVEKILPILREKNKLEDYLLVEIGWGVVKHYLPNNIAEMLKEKIAEKYKGSFPPKTLDSILTAPNQQDEAIDDVRKKTQPKKKTTKKERPKGTPDISSFFAPKKK